MVSENRLQAQCYCLISDFVYLTDRRGSQYGWDAAQYSTPEKFMGERFTNAVYARTSEDSRNRVLEHLRNLLPGTDEAVIRKFLQ